MNDIIEMELHDHPFGDTNDILSHPDAAQNRGARLIRYVPKCGIGIAIVRVDANDVSKASQGYRLGSHAIEAHVPPWWKLQ